MIERMGVVLSHMSPNQAVVWRTVVVKDELFNQYLSKGRRAARILREHSPQSQWLRKIDDHVWRSLMAPVDWSDDWLTVLTRQPRPDGRPEVSEFVEAAQALATDQLHDPEKKVSLRKSLCDELSRLISQQLAFRVVLSGNRHKNDWVTFLRSLPGNEDKNDAAIESDYFISASRLHQFFQPIDCLVFAGRIWATLAGHLHQIISAPRWGTFLHVMMQGTPVHDSFPDFSVPQRLRLSCASGDLVASLAAGDETKHQTVLLSFQRQYVVQEGPARASIAGPPTLGPSDDGGLIPEEPEELEEEFSQHAQYSGLAFKLATQSGHVLYQPLFNDGRRGTYRFLNIHYRTLRRTSSVEKGMLLLCPRSLKTRSETRKADDVGQWKELLREAIRSRGLAAITKDLRKLSDPIKLKRLKGAMRRWSRKSMLNAPMKKGHFRTLYRYLYPVEAGMELDREVRIEEAWQSIQRQRRAALRRAVDLTKKRASQLHQGLENALRHLADIHHASISQLGSAVIVDGLEGTEIYRDDVLLLFFSKVTDVALEPVLVPANRCRTAYRTRQR